MSRKVLAWVLVLAALAAEGAPALAGTRPAPCRPYTVEEVCPPGRGYCSLRMVYAPGQSPGIDRRAYWYPAPHRSLARTWHAHPAKIHRTAAVHHKAKKWSHHVATCTYRCWYRHPPQHGF